MRVGGQVGGGDDVVGPHQREVAEQDRRRHAELFRGAVPVAAAVLVGEQPVHGRQPAAGGRGVDDVVVHQRAGVQQLERREQPQHDRLDRVIGGVGHRAPAPVGERRAQPLAAAQHELFEGGGQLGVVGADVGGVAAAIAEIVPQLSVTAPANSTADGAAASTLSGRPFPY